MKRFSTILTALGLSLVASQAIAFQPDYSNFGLVAGEEGEQGYRDGPFYQALFSHPAGLALSGDETQLYVADNFNNCLRVIRLDQNNLVSTLAGSVTAGYQDGPVSTALFKNPTALALIPQNRLLVWDEGNGVLRLVDLDKHTVTTFAGGDERKGIIRDPSFIQAPVGGVWDMVYQAPENSIYLSEPDAGALLRLDLTAKKSSYLLNRDPRFPAPGSFCLSQGKLFLADRKTAAINRIEAGPKGISGDPVNLSGTATYQIASMQASGGAVYGLPYDSNQYLKLDSPIVPVTLTSNWGDAITNPVAPYSMLRSHDERVRLLARPSREGGFFVANPGNGAIYHCAYYNIETFKSGANKNVNGLTDYDYPPAKPHGTYRILLLGVSQLIWETDLDHKKWDGVWNRQETFPKRLEQILNAEAALDDADLHYEVLVDAQTEMPWYIWPYRLLPDTVKKFDVDQVVYFAVPFGNAHMDLFYNHPLDAEGIPSLQDDPEYLLKPFAQRNTNAAYARFFKLCQQENLASLNSNGQPGFLDMSNLIEKPDTRAMMEQMCGKPFQLLADRFKGMRTSGGKPVDFQICFYPMTFMPFERFEVFWGDLSRICNVPFIDLKDSLLSVKSSFYPMMEAGPHFTGDGHMFTALLLAHEWIRRGVIPWKSSDKDPHEPEKK